MFETCIENASLNEHFLVLIRMINDVKRSEIKCQCRYCFYLI